MLFGGTWSKIQGRFIMTSSSSYSAGDTGGSNDAAVISHSHSAFTSSACSHTHAIASNGSHSHSVTVNTTGSSGTNKNMPAYIVLNALERIV